MADNHYISRKSKLLKDFDRTAKRIESVLAPRYGNALSGTLLKETRREYEALIPELPYIGGKKNRLTKNLVGSAWCLALYRALKRHGKTAEDAGKILCETVQAQLDAYPRSLLRFLGMLRFSTYGIARLKKQAEESRRRRYAGNWVFTVLTGDGKEFDYGVDYTECGICKFFHAQGADELTPFLCALDFPMSEAFDTGLARTMTIAGGDDRCDFRYKKGRKVAQELPPVHPEIDGI